jgi:hypothetical protein
MHCLCVVAMDYMNVLPVLSMSWNQILCRIVFSLEVGTFGSLFCMVTSKDIISIDTLVV